MEVVFFHPIIHRLWSHPEQADDELEENEAPDAQLPPDTDVSCVEWSLDQSHIQQLAEDLGDTSSSEHTSGSRIVEEGCTVLADESDEAGVDFDWEGLGDSVSEIEAHQEKDSERSEASLPDTASLHDKFPHID